MKWVHRTRLKELECYSFVVAKMRVFVGLKKLYGMGDPLSPSSILEKVQTYDPHRAFDPS